MNAAEVHDQAEQLRAYLAKRGNLGATAWLTSKGFSGPDRARVLTALGDAEEERAS